MKVKKRTIIIWILVGVILLSSLGVFLLIKNTNGQNSEYEVSVEKEVNHRLFALQGLIEPRYEPNSPNKVEDGDTIELIYCTEMVSKKAPVNEFAIYFSGAFSNIVTKRNKKNGLKDIYKTGLYNEFLRFVGFLDVTEEGTTVFTFTEYTITFKISIDVVCYAEPAELVFEGAKTTKWNPTSDLEPTYAFEYEKDNGYSLPREMSVVYSDWQVPEKTLLSIPREKMHNYMSDFSKFDGEKFVGCSFDLENQAPGIYKVRVTVSLNECTSDDLFIIEEDPFYSEVSYENFDEYILLVIE